MKLYVSIKRDHHSLSWLNRLRLWWSLFFSSEVLHIAIVAPLSHSQHINKIFGGFTLPHHHRNSSRLGWSIEEYSNYTEDKYAKISLWKYAYKKGIRSSLKVATFTTKNIDMFHVGFSFSIAKSLFFKNLPLFPYYGGTEKAPYDCIFIFSDKPIDPIEYKL